MVQSDANPQGVPLEVFDGFRSAVAANRAQFYRDVPSGPLYGFNREGVKVSQGLIDNWWRQGMVGDTKAHYDCIAAFSEADFTEDLKAITVPVLIIHGENDQVVPIENSAHKAIKLVRDGKLKASHRYRSTIVWRDNQHTLRMRDDVDGEDRVAIDPNDWSEDSADALGEWAASDDGRLLAYGVQIGGTDWRTIRVLDVDSGKMLDDEVNWARFTGIVWAKDGSGFFYSRYPEPDAQTAATARVNDHAVYFHALGMPQEDDRLVYSDPDRPGVLHMVDRTHDGRYLLVYPTPGVGVNASTSQTTAGLPAV